MTNCNYGKRSTGKPFNGKKLEGILNRYAKEEIPNMSMFDTKTSTLYTIPNETMVNETLLYPDILPSSHVRSLRGGMDKGHTVEFKPNAIRH